MMPPKTNRANQDDRDFVDGDDNGYAQDDQDEDEDELNEMDDPRGDAEAEEKRGR